MRLRPSLALWLVLPALSVPPARAATSDRIAVEERPGETPADAAFAFLEACLRLGTAPEDVRPVQRIQTHGKTFVRLVVQGPSVVMRCLNELSGRDAIDGTIHWLDGSSGGLLHSTAGSQHEVIIPDSEWYAPDATLPLPPVDESFIDQLMRGAESGRDRLKAMSLTEAQIQLGGLVRRGSPAALAALERIAASDPRWPVRRTALLSLDPGISGDTIFKLARRDEAWQVRLAGVNQLNAITRMQSIRSDNAAALLLRIAREDTDWTVQREAIWSLSSAQVRESSNALLDMVWQEKLDGRVRAVALEALGGVGKIPHEDLHRALTVPVEPVRAVAAAVLVTRMKPDDPALLWKAFNDPDRLVRLAASPFLYRIEDDTVGPQVWHQFLAEADQVDADPDFERAIMDLLGRHPFPGLGEAVVGRLSSGSLSPDERRQLARLLAKIDPEKATQLFKNDLTGPNVLARSVAADAIPDSPYARAARETLLADPNPQVRAGALLGLCRSAKAPLSGLLGRVELPSTALGQEARAAAMHCGAVEPAPWRFTTTLGIPTNARANQSRLPALLGMALLLFHVVATKLSAGATVPQTTQPAPKDPQ